MTANNYTKRQKARRSIEWASELIWVKAPGGYCSAGFQASYRITKDNLTGNWCAYITRGYVTFKAPWRENTLKAAKESCLAEELDSARREIQ